MKDTTSPATVPMSLEVRREAVHRIARAAVNAYGTAEWQAVADDCKQLGIDIGDMGHVAALQVVWMHDRRGLPAPEYAMAQLGCC